MANKNIKILYNTAGSNKLGMGHIYNSLKLADKFRKEYDAKICYLLPSDSGPGIDLVQRNNYELKIFGPNNNEGYIKTIKEFQPDIIINDVLYIKEEFMRCLKNLDSLIINFEHIKEPKSLGYSDIIFNSVYPPFISPKGDYYHGPKYAPLNESFKNIPKKKININCKNFYISFGGSDPSKFTIKAIEALDRLEDITSTVLLGAGFNHNHLEELEKLLKKTGKNKFNIREKHDIDYINQADIGVVSGGYTIYELAATGTPSLALSHNEMEAERLKLFSEDGITMDLGKGKVISNITVDNLFLSIKEFIDNYELREKMSKTQQELVDGKGLDRIVEIIIDKFIDKKLNWKEGNFYNPIWT